MAASFEVDRAFALEDRGLFVLAGRIRDGTVRVGMTAVLSGGDESFERPVHGIEFPEDASQGTDAPKLCLTFHYRDEDRLSAWMGIDWEGRVLELVW